ncbi:MAG: hypothetical protein ACRD2Z_03140 [Thermoanaerobaculia bacterium]
MVNYPVHDVDSAPESSQPLLRDLRQGLGMIPNLAATMAESPELLRGFLAVREIFYGGTFSPAEIQVLALTNDLSPKGDREPTLGRRPPHRFDLGRRASPSQRGR